MRRIGILLIILCMAHAQAEPVSYGVLNLDRLSAVYAEALGFIAPRILEPVPISRLTVWGLRGMTSLDPALQVEAADSRLRLLRKGQTISDWPAPDGEAAEPWAKVAVGLTAAGYSVSLPLRRAGTQESAVPWRLGW